MSDGRQRRGGMWVELILTGAALALTVWFHGWTVATEGGFGPVGDQDYYNAMVQGWRSGHTYLAIAPHPEMLRLADPYDPAQNAPYRLPDASFYHGHYYLYFGAAPAAVLMAPYLMLTGSAMSTATAVFVFSTVALCAGTVLWLLIRRRYFPASAAWIAPMGVLVLGFGTHLLALARRPMWWELPIAAEIAFLVLALLAVYAALHATTTRRRMHAGGAAGLALGLAIASRPTAVFASVMVVPVLAYAAKSRGERGWRAAVFAGLAALTAGGIALGAYNYARFGSPLEFGQRYQLSGMHEGKLRHFAVDYIAPNFQTYFLQPLRWRWEFPFVELWTRSVSVRDYFDGEEMAGLLSSFPVLILAVGAVCVCRGRVGEERRRLGAVVLAVALYFAGVAGILHLFFSATERYGAELGFGLGLLALFGWLGLERGLRCGRVAPMFHAATLAFAGLSVGTGVLVSFDYHGELLRRDGPATWRRLERLSDDALGRLGLALGQFSGPQVLKVRFRDQPAGTVETFWASADERAGERIDIEYLPRREIRFGYARGGGSVSWGRPLRWEPRHTHTVELQLPSLYPPPHGLMRGLRYAIESRERSSVAVWFSGGRALGLVVAPLPVDVSPGGAIGAQFSGELRGTSARLYRNDEVESAQVPVAPHRGGILRLRVRIPSELSTTGEPLLTTGVRYGSDMVFLRESRGGTVVCFEHFPEPAVVSAPMALPADREHVIEIRMPSCAAGVVGLEMRGVTTVTLDGQEVLRRDGVCFGFDPTDLGIGVNALGTTCLAQFRGWITAAEWVSE